MSAIATRVELRIYNRTTSDVKINGGEGGIRTHGGRKPTPVFETGFAHPPSYDEDIYQST